MSKKKNNKQLENKYAPMNPWAKFGLLISCIGFIVSLFFNIRSCAIQQPQTAKLNDEVKQLTTELNQLKQDFPMVQNYYEALDISKAIPSPEPLEDTKNFDYFPTVLLNMSQQPIGDFPTAPYGYVLRLSTGNNKYFAVDSADNSADKKVVFSISELREKRKSLIWFLYTGPFPPEGWTTFK